MTEETVWVGKWVRAEEGKLTLNDGRLRFANAEHCLFDAPMQKFEKIVWHWYSFGGAFEVWIDGANYFVSFVPRHARFKSWYAGLAEGHKWRAAIEGRPIPKRGPLGAKIFLSLYSLFQAFFYAFAGVAVHEIVGWVFIGPGGVATLGAHCFKNCVAAQSLGWVNRDAVAVGILAAGELRRVDDVQRNIGCVVKIDAFVKSEQIAGWTGAGGVGGIPEIAVIADVVKEAVADGRAAGYESE